jgi:glycopeptide antibiotics resistance protein
MVKDPLVSFLFIVVGLTIYATLFPFHFSMEHSAFLEWSLPDGRGQWLDVLLNLYFFMPMGMLCGILFHSKSGFLLAFFGAFGLSLGVELAQAYIPGRYSSLRDVFLNSIGAYLGMLLAQMPIFDRELFTRNLRQFISLRGTFLLFSLWTVVQFFPFVPILKFHQLRLFSVSTLGWQSFNAKIIEVICFSVFVVLLWREHHSRKSTLWFGTILFLLSPGQVLLWGREVVPAEIVASMIGLAIGFVLVLGKVELDAKWLAAVSIALLSWRELQPFQWESSAIQDFGWIPLKATFDTPRGESIRNLCLKCFLYWYTLRQIQRSTGIPLLKGSVAMAAVFAITEFGQCYQIGRTPEITDSMICLLGAAPFLSIDDAND